MIKQIEYIKFDSFITEFTEKAILETCIQVQTQAREHAPVKDGRLKASITLKTNKVNGGLSAPVKAGEGVVGSPLEYAVYQEFGTRNVAPQPFLRPAVASVVYGQSNKQVLKKIADEKAKGNLKENGHRVKFF